MLTDTQALAASAVLFWVMFMTAGFMRIPIWTTEGMRIALGNRERVPEISPLGARAERAAKNMFENLVVFAVLVLGVHVAGKEGSASRAAANLFFWARLAYWPTYLAGVPLVRTAVWLASVAGLALLAVVAFRGAP